MFFFIYIKTKNPMKNQFFIINTQCFMIYLNNISTQFENN